MACNTPLGPLLGLMGGQIGLAPPCPSTNLFSPEYIIPSALVEQCPALYVIYARRRGLRVNCIKRKGLLTLLDGVIKTEFGRGSKSLLLIRVYWYCIPISTKANMASFSNKKFKRNLNELDSSDNETEVPFPRLIIIESNSAPITNLSPFIIEKVISTNLTPISVKKMKKSNSACRGRKEETR